MAFLFREKTRWQAPVNYYFCSSDSFGLYFSSPVSIHRIKSFIFFSSHPAARRPKIILAASLVFMVLFSFLLCQCLPTDGIIICCDYAYLKQPFGSGMVIQQLVLTSIHSLTDSSAAYGIVGPLVRVSFCDRGVLVRFRRYFQDKFSTCIMQAALTISYFRLQLPDSRAGTRRPAFSFFPPAEAPEWRVCHRPSERTEPFL